MPETLPSTSASLPVWEVGALCRAVGDALAARFNPVSVRGEIGGFFPPGHCYFTLKDAQGQIRHVQARRQRPGLAPRDGELVELQRPA